MPDIEPAKYRNTKITESVTQNIDYRPSRILVFREAVKQADGDAGNRSQST